MRQTLHSSVPMVETAAPGGPPGEALTDAEDLRVAVLGLGFVGLTLSVTLADVGLEVTGVESRAEVVDTLRSGECHFHEVGLREALRRHLAKNLTVTGELVGSGQQVFVIAVGTPVDRESKVPVLAEVEAAARQVGRALTKGALVVLRSTVPVGTTREVALPILESESGLRAGDGFGLVFAPERTMAGQALRELRELPQIVGGFDRSSVQRAGALFGRMTDSIVEMDGIEAAEMAKIVENGFRDVTFGFANQMALLCERLGIDMVKVTRAINACDPPSRVPVPSPGVGGACLSKDPHILLDVGRRHGYEPSLVRETRATNEAMPGWVAAKLSRLLESVGKAPEQSTAFVLGFAFKGRPETSDMRDAPTLALVSELRRLGLKVLGHDPNVPAGELGSTGAEPTDIEEGFRRADAVVLMTNHVSYESLDITSLLATMRLPGVFLDGWQLFERDLVASVPGVCHGGVGFV